jgi:hypothetical protein
MNYTAFFPIGSGQKFSGLLAKRSALGQRAPFFAAASLDIFGTVPTASMQLRAPLAGCVRCGASRKNKNSNSSSRLFSISAQQGGGFV